MTDDLRHLRIEKTVTRFQEAAHERFRHEPGTEEHEEALETEIELDHELDDVIREETRGVRQGG